VVGAAIAQCTRITTVNGPGVSLTQMQHVANEITSKANLPAQDLASQNQINSQLNVGTAGMSVIDGLNGGLPGTNTTLGIPTSYGGLVGSHSSIVAMNAAEAVYRDAGGVLNPGSANLSDTYNFPDTAGAGRGVVNPDAGTPNTPDKPTVFNSATALPNYSGDNAITIQPGDTVSSIAKRYDMTEQAFSSFLKGQYGEGADLGVCQQSCPLFYTAIATFSGDLACALGGFSHTSLMYSQLRVCLDFHRPGLLHLAAS
jgi:LysM repeat protein